MSITRLNVTALQRDLGDPKSSKNQPKEVGDVSESTPLNLGETFASLIPSEPFALYTAAVAVFIQQIQENEPQDQYIEMRWTALVLFAFFIPVYMFIRYRQNGPTRQSERARTAPWAELVSATVAFVALALISPGSPLAAVLDASAEAVTIGLIGVLGSAFLLLMGNTLTKRVKEK